VVSFTTRGRFAPGRYPLDSWLGGPQRQFRHGVEEKNSQPPPGFEPRSTDRQTLYRLSYPGSSSNTTSFLNTNKQDITVGSRTSAELQYVNPKIKVWIFSSQIIAFWTRAVHLGRNEALQCSFRVIKGLSSSSNGWERAGRGTRCQNSLIRP
jgi:hypothetical protein